jgi:integrase
VQSDDQRAHDCPYCLYCTRSVGLRGEERGLSRGLLVEPIIQGQRILRPEQRIADQSVRRMLQKRGKQVGIQAFSSQDLRRIFIYGLLDEGVDIATAQRLAGHCSELTPQRYDQGSEPERRGLARMLEVPIRGSWGAAECQVARSG